jgi:DNA modification methylase
VAPGYWFFKLFSSIKEEHEVEFAKLELLSLVGPVEPIRNFADVIEVTPLKHFTSDPNRVQDILTYEPCYGPIQGFMTTTQKPPDLERLARRLAYTREIIGVLSKESEQVTPRILNGLKRRGRASIRRSDDYNLIRIVTNQYYLEKSYYVSKLSRDEVEVRRNIRVLIEYPFREIYRIPASATMSVGKRLQDYFAIREEPSLYLTHQLHPYKGKFHPKMVRALLNYVMPIDSGEALDNFAGSGTLLLESTLMGVHSIGVELNPLSVLMSKVKSESMSIRPTTLKRGIAFLTGELAKALDEYQTVVSGGTLLVQRNFDLAQIEERKERIPKTVKDTFEKGEVIHSVVLAQQIIEKSPLEQPVKDFLLLGLSGAISDLARRTSQDFVTTLSDRLSWMYLRIFLFSLLNKHLSIKSGKSETYIGDARDMRNCKTLRRKQVSVEDNSIDAIVNSPPYSAALDYVRNDLPQLTSLDLAESLDQLQANMIGNPNLADYSDRRIDDTFRKESFYSRLPREARSALRGLVLGDRRREAMRVYKFFKDMHLALLEIRRVLKPGAKAVIIIGNNHYKLNGHYVEVKNDEIIAKMAEALGFMRDANLPPQSMRWQKDRKIKQIKGGIRRPLQKSMPGMIRYESVLVLENATNQRYLAAATRPS